MSLSLSDKFIVPTPSLPACELYSPIGVLFFFLPRGRVSCPIKLDNLSWLRCVFITTHHPLLGIIVRLCEPTPQLCLVCLDPPQPCLSLVIIYWYRIKISVIHSRKIYPLFPSGYFDSFIRYFSLDSSKKFTVQSVSFVLCCQTKTNHCQMLSIFANFITVISVKFFELILLFFGDSKNSNSFLP